MAPTFRNPQTVFTVDLNAPLSAWPIVNEYYSAADCESAERDLIETAAKYPHGIIPFFTLCIATDDPSLEEH
jgi:hypothetical protein